MKIAVMGLGGIGGVTAAALSGAGFDVTGFGKREEIVQAIRRDGICVTRDGKTLVSRFDTFMHPGPGMGPFDLVLLAVPPSFLLTAIEGIIPVAPDAMFVCFQNGLAEDIAATVLPAPQVLGGVVWFGASMLGPGKVEKTSGGGYTVGRLNGVVDDEVHRVADVLRSVADVEITQNLRGERWSKLALNCVISSLGTIGGQRLGVLMRHRFVRRLALEIMTEATLVGRASGVSFAKVAGGTLDLEWMALDDEDRTRTGSPSLLAKHAVLMAVGARYRRLRSSMLAAIERGRPSSVMFLNGEVTKRAGEHGLSAPVNAAVVRLVRDIENQKVESSLDTLKRLFADTRG